MKLTQEQIKKIESYLDYKKLEQVDLRYEVLDHMAQSIEAAMEKRVSFKDAFNQQTEKWNPELESYSSWWLGIVYVGPKLVMKKCVRMIKEIYLSAFFTAFLISGGLLFLNKYSSISFLGNFLDIFVKSLIPVILLVSLFLLYKIERCGIKTTYQYFFRRHNWGFTYCLIPLMINGTRPFFTSIFGFLELFFLLFAIIASLQFYKIYQKHIQVLKRLA